MLERRKWLGARLLAGALLGGQFRCGVCADGRGSCCRGLNLISGGQKGTVPKIEVMPLYHFAADNSRVRDDSEGTEFPNDEAAR